MRQKKKPKGGEFMSEYTETGRKLLKKMATNKEEEVLFLYEEIEKRYSYLLNSKLKADDINRYNALVDAYVYNHRLKVALKERK